jgi:hypothetical protein
MTTLPPLPKAWFFFGLDDLRETDSTYEAFDYTKLPPLPTDKLNGSWQWLQDEYANIEAVLDSPNLPEDWFESLQTIQRQAQERNLILPQGFVTLMQHPEWLAAIPSPTDCFFELDHEGFIDLKDRPGESLVHFYSDSQYCLVWYLHFTINGQCNIVCSSNWFFHTYYYDYEPIREAYRDEASEIIDELQRGPHTFLFECEGSFEAFVYRVWMEGSIWFEMNLGHQSLTPAQQRYMDFYNP